MRVKLTDTFARTTAPGLFWDEDRRAPAGFLLRVTQAGARAWCLNYRVKESGRERRVTIGSFPDWSTAQARKRAAELRREVDAGGDPLGDLEDRRSAPTVAELTQRFIAEALPSRAKGTQAEYRAILAAYVVPALGSRKVADVTRDDVEKLHRRITAEGKPRRAGSVKALISTMFNQAIVWGLRTDNPASRVKGNPEQPHERYLNEAEVARLEGQLEVWPRQDTVDAVRLAMFTGARRGEITDMRWSDVDLADAVWSNAGRTKQRRLHRAPLSAAAVEILRRRQSEREAARTVVPLRQSDWVFPANFDGTLERDWKILRACAGLRDVRFHDLRHSFASWLVGEGVSLPIVGAMLGHSAARTTMRYAHLADAPLRQAAETVSRIVGGGKK